MHHIDGLERFFYRFWEKQAALLNQVGSKVDISFASRAKPGKHFLVETDDEDGQLENGSVQAGSVLNENDKNRSAKGNDYAGEFFFFTKPL